MGASAYSIAVLADSPRVWWKSNETSGHFADSSGNGQTSTFEGGSLVYNQPGPIGGVPSCFNGGGQRRDPNLSTATNNFTVETWLKLSALPGGETQLFNNGNTAFDGYGINVLATGAWRAVCNNVAFLSTSTSLLGTSNFRHLVVVRSAGTWSYYLDGAVETANAGATAPNAIGGSHTAWCFSALSAYLSNLAIYDTALSGARIAAHYAAMLQAEGGTPPSGDGLPWWYS